MKKPAFIFLFAFCILHFAYSQENPRMQWFKDAKLGIFIHWGIYSVNGIDESWSFYNEYLPYQDYMKQLDGFTASNYDPQAWAKLIRESGAKYAVMTSKHHDGVALWQTEDGILDVVKMTPAGRDLVGPFCKALRAEGIKVGLYYSLIDWSHPDYPNFTKTQKRYTDDSLRWERFSAFNMGQVEEIATKFNPDLIWFDGDWEHKAETWHAAEIREMLIKNNKNIIINSRLAGYGDYATPEQGIPVNKPADVCWELCMTMNDSWGYQPNDKNYKSAGLIIRIFADVIGMGGNLLLDIGPKEDGSIPEEQFRILQDLGTWTSKHTEAIYGTSAGIPKDCYYGASTLSKDSTVLYLFVPTVRTMEHPDPHTVMPSYSPTVLLKGVTNEISTMWAVGNGIKPEQKTWLKPWWSGNPGLITIEIPREAQDALMTVIAVQLEGKIALKF